MKQKLTLLFSLFMLSAMAQKNKKTSFLLLDSLTKLPLQGASVIAYPQNTEFPSSEVGLVHIDHAYHALDQLAISAIGYKRKILNLRNTSHSNTIYLTPQHTQLSEVTISSFASNPNLSVGLTDIANRGVSNSQEILRMVPGLFIAQHQGGGKAEQIFLRGFDNDHGKDIALSLDGMPINMVSHAHGQGYADSHFIIPEVIENITYKKGTFDSDKGDLAVSGWVDYHTKDAIQNTVSAEAGDFRTFRGIIMLNLLGQQSAKKGQHWYFSSEYRYSDAYFEHSQHFKRFNFFSKYNGKISPKSYLSLSASAFSSNWRASGQIPEEAVETGQVDYFGAIDPNEGGKTSRYNLNLVLKTSLGHEGVIKNQIYFSKYKFDLHSNFTLYLNDKENGDEIRQRESRNLLGYNGSYKSTVRILGIESENEVGLNSRFDFTANSELSHTINRYTLLDRVKLGDISEYSFAPYISETVQISRKLKVNLGLRFDQFFYTYKNKFEGDTSFNGLGLYKARNHSFSPKINFYYNFSEHAQSFLSLGKGLNSNDARAVVAPGTVHSLPSAYGIDAGTVMKPSSKILISGTLWYNFLQSEFVYGGDGGSVEFNGKTRRIGADLSLRFQPLASVYLDADVNYANGRALDQVRGRNYIPLSPRWSSTGGISLKAKKGFNGSFRYRYLGSRPAKEDYTLVAEGYLVNDLVLNYSIRQINLGVIVNNIFNVRWKESQFVEETRLRGQQPTEGITFTPGTPFFTTCRLSYSF
jgi:hypothetical protein